MKMARPPVIRDQDRIDVRLTGEADYRIPFTFIEALNEGTLFDRPAHAFLFSLNLRGPTQSSETIL
jgi:hypothetical protein